ncbi:MAG: GGDEF domain-containing protein, partial [Methylomonas sp.]|nr:GGDEF domain-containing protein [Methylomonas sp.]
MEFARNVLSDNVRILKSQVSKTAYQGVAIAIASIILATLGVSLYQTGGITLDSIVKAQSENYGLWVLDSIPFVFGFWGQYSSSIIAYQAGAMIFDQTHELRAHAESMEKQANYSATHDIATDLPNRVLFYDRVEQAILSAGKQNKLLS